MKLAILTALWKRPRLTHLVARHIARLDIAGVDIIVAAAYSEPSYDVPAGWLSVEVPNVPRYDKMNAACELLRPEDVDAALLIGSDDLVHASYIQRALSALSEGHDYVTPVDLWFFDALDHRLAYGIFDRMGGGRMMSRGALETCDFAPWHADPRAKTRNMDWAMGKRLGMLCPVKMLPPDSATPILSVKTDTNITPFDRLTPKARRWKRAGTWLRTWFPESADELLHWQEVTA